jgi:hypothetical protein
MGSFVLGVRFDVIVGDNSKKFKILLFVLSLYEILMSHE